MKETTAVSDRFLCGSCPRVSHFAPFRWRSWWAWFLLWIDSLSVYHLRWWSEFFKFLSDDHKQDRPHLIILLLLLGSVLQLKCFTGYDMFNLSVTCYVVAYVYSQVPSVFQTMMWWVFSKGWAVHSDDLIPVHLLIVSGLDKSPKSKFDHFHVLMDLF